VSKEVHPNHSLSMFGACYLKPKGPVAGPAPTARRRCRPSSQAMWPPSLLVRAVPAGPEPPLPDGISIMAHVALGNWVSAGMGKVFLIGSAIGVATLIGVATFVIQL
jgi:hypothetical protein